MTIDPVVNIKKALKPFRKDLGQDYVSYFNHTIRVYRYACMLSLQRESEIYLVAAAFHDLDIWISGSMNYLDGSCNLASEYCSRHFPHVDTNRLGTVIRQHHQLTTIKGNPEAEIFRKADWTDLTSGWVKFNLPKSLIRDQEHQLPRLGFGKIIFLKCLKHAVRHPLHPFPMIKW